MDKKEIIVGTLIIVLIGLLFIKPIQASLALSRADVPLVNDAWYDALQAIKEDSEDNPGQPWEKGIITSWWDFGHHFKYFTNRAVTFDGGTQVTPQAHWVGKLFLSSDENTSVAILRMLDCGGNKAFDKINENMNDAAKTVNQLNRVFNDELAGRGIDESTYDSNKNLFCNPTPGYVIASEDMVGKAGVWGHFGSWDFNRADMWINVKKMTRENGTKYILEKGYAPNKTQAEQLWSQLQIMTESEANNWIAPWPGYASVSDCVPSQCMDFNNSGVPQDETSLVMKGRVNFTDCMQCSNGAKIINNEITLNGAYPASFIYVENGGVVEKRYDSVSHLSYSFVLTPENKLITATPELAGSLFTRLFYLQGVGLKNFQLLTKTQNIDGFKIYIYKVKWQNTSSDSQIQS